LTNFDTTARGELSYDVHWPQTVNQARIDVVKNIQQKIGSLTFEAEKCRMHSMAFNQETGSIHVQLLQSASMHFRRAGAESHLALQGPGGWSKPATITEANGATSKARMVWAGRSTYIIYHDRRGKFFTRTISQGPTDAEGD